MLLLAGCGTSPPPGVVDPDPSAARGSASPSPSPSAHAAGHLRITNDVTPPPLHTLTLAGNGTEPIVSPDVMSDLRTYAQQSGQDLDDVIASQAGSSELGALLGEISAHDPTFVGSALSTDRAAYDYQVQFSRRPGPDVLRRLDSLAGVTRVQWGGTLTVEAMQDIGTTAMSALSAQPDVILPAASGCSFDEARTGVRVEFARVDGVDDDQVRAAVAEAMRRAEAVADRPVRITFQEGAGVVTNAQTGASDRGRAAD